MIYPVAFGFSTFGWWWRRQWHCCPLRGGGEHDADHCVADSAVAEDARVVRGKRCARHSAHGHDRSQIIEPSIPTTPCTDTPGFDRNRQQNLIEQAQIAVGNRQVARMSSCALTGSRRFTLRANLGCTEYGVGALSRYVSIFSQSSYTRTYERTFDK